MGIKDEFHQKNILVCIEELCQPSTVTTETTGHPALGTTTSGVAVESGGCSLGVTYPSNNVVNKSHNLKPHSFSVLEKCSKCHKYLRGLLHQGFLCQGTSVFLLYQHRALRWVVIRRSTLNWPNSIIDARRASSRVTSCNLILYIFVRFLYFSW